MKANEKAKELIEKMYYCNRFDDKENYIPAMALERAKQCALMAVQEIILSNPHSNPFNTDVYSTMSYWEEVKTEIEKL
jgi:hypothetical protein